VKDKRIADSAKTATEKHIEKLIKLKVYRVMTLSVCSSAFVKKTRTPKHPAEEDSDSEVGPRAYVVSMIQSDLLSSSEGGSRAMPEIDDNNDSLPGLLDDDSIPVDAISVTVRHVRRCLPLRSRFIP
jgi:hypothetical protein